MLLVPPNTGTLLTLTLTPSGAKMSTPPKMAEELMTRSSVMVAPRRSRVTPPNTAVTLAPVNSSWYKDARLPLNTAEYSTWPSWADMAGALPPEHPSKDDLKADEH